MKHEKDFFFPKKVRCKPVHESLRRPLLGNWIARLPRPDSWSVSYAIIR